MVIKVLICPLLFQYFLYQDFYKEVRIKNSPRDKGKNEYIDGQKIVLEEKVNDKINNQTIKISAVEVQISNPLLFFR